MDTIQGSAVPELVPARMLNEYAYCPRLFFLEWVDQLWAASADTAEGERRHRRVDSGGGAVPLPLDGEVKAARSVELSSERLGIIGQLDLLEGSDGMVVPVDTKKGRPAPGGGPWDADAVQVCAQVLLLREHGYTADRGEIFYAETRQRVPVEVTSELVARTMEIVSSARMVAARLAPPPPLRSSPKCQRCSLAGICLPDEHHVLAGRLAGPPLRPPRLPAAGHLTIMPRDRGLVSECHRHYLSGPVSPYFATEISYVPDVSCKSDREGADAVNCLLSFCYGLLTKELLAACLAVGFDPYIGLYHRPRFGRPALALDLAEEFRPLLADSTVLTLINNREVSPSSFLVRAGAVALTAEGRRAVIRAWERRMTTEVRHPLFGYKVSYRRAAELQARILAARLTGELPAYEPLVTR